VLGTHTGVDCVEDDAPADLRWEFFVEVLDESAVGSYPYGIEVLVDGEVVHREEGNAEVLPPSGSDLLWPYRHGDVELTGVEPGSTVEVWPEFLQEDPIFDGAAALMLEFYHSSYYGAAAIADYDNCQSDDYSVTCFVTDFPDAVGSVFTPSVPVTYEVTETAPGPTDICVCSYSVNPVDAEDYAYWKGEYNWDPASDNLFGLREVKEPESEFGGADRGSISLVTTANPFDLSLADANAKGAKGDEVTLTVPVKNLGPADAYGFFDEPGSYYVLGTLPKGLELVNVTEEEGWTCMSAEEVPYFVPEVDADDIDFGCFFSSLADGEAIDLEFTVKITDASSKAKGTLEIAARDEDGYPGVADADMKNNTADITVNAAGGGKGQLPKTGTSLGLIIGAAALVLVVGIVLMVLTARKRKAGAEE
jgi:LPXTG-motif cell wall-anchored protein